VLQRFELTRDGAVIGIYGCREDAERGIEEGLRWSGGEREDYVITEIPE
jgi:hypothetical protein